MWPAPDDLAPTQTSVDQRSTEDAIYELIAPHTGAGAQPLPPLRRDEHAAFLLRILEPLPAPYVAFDSNRAWLIYWIAHSLDLMGMPLTGALQARAISTLLHFQDKVKGGFGGGPGQMGHLMSTYAAVCALAIVGGPGGLPTDEDVAHGRSVDVGRGGWDCIEKEALYEWMMRLKQPDGSFLVHEQGEIDVRATYCVISIASLLGLVTDELLAGVGDYIASCQTYEGGFAAMSCAEYVADGARVAPLQPVAQQHPQGEAHGGYAFCAFASHVQLALLGRAGPVDTDALLRWATSLQGSLYEGGGFRGRTNKLVDGCYGWFCGGGLMTCLEGLMLPPHDAVHDADDDTGSWESLSEHDGDLLDRAALQTYILAVAQAPRGGLRDKPGKRPDAYHTCYNLSGLSMTQHRLRPSPSAVASAAAACPSSDALLRACYSQSLGWAVQAAGGSDAVHATHPLFNVALPHAERIMSYCYT
ncbi:protein farnesyltransferase [Malassezia japonica]|uniref:Protein farnesyltransferase subunit beta n=1 Tax=Malassezia japonica TaxID=223818 RepID=A0AAF0EYJ0_9BASI|nr:protein farnesyltransferase [Malassezia japonica]WFD37554.1 protein farnesyltransferase [Malassezia japonica]